MNRSDENACVGYGKENVQGGGLGIGGGKAPGQVGRTRRALSAINRNVVAPVRPPVTRKRELIKEKPVVPDKVPQFPPVGRPMTRSFAAQLANKQQPCLLDNFLPRSSNPFPYPVNSKSSNPNPIALEDCIIVDVEEYRAANDSKTPLAAEEEMIDNIDEMEEDEMEDYESDEDDMAVQTGRKRPRNAAIRNDIDDNDRNDPLAVVEYISDIYSFHKKIENSGCVPPNYMDRQLDINEKMRTILIDWLIEVHYKFELMDETLFLMVNLIDRFLAREMVERKKLQLVGVTALLIASKYEEISVPIVNDLLVITDKAYTRQDVLDMERLIVNRLQFNMTVPTPYVFLRRFLKVVQSDRKLEFLSLFMVELCLVEYEMLKFPPSLLAAAAVFTAQCTINRFKHWDDTSEWHTTYSEEQLLECSKMMVGFHQRAGTGKHTGVHKKYSLIKFGHVARCEPASFLLQTRL